MSSLSKPNVIVVLTDQQRWDTTGVHHNPLGLTPNFDRMAREGTHFSLAFTCQPVCGPARSCIQTGKYATTTGCYRNSIPLPPNSRTLAHYFREAGYQTGYIGKWHLSKSEPVIQEERGGYDYWLAANLLEFSSDAYDMVMYDNDNKRKKLPGYRVDAEMDAAIRYIDNHQDKPFFLFISFLEPHHQNHSGNYPAPTGYAEQYTGRWMPPDLTSLIGDAPQQIGGYYGMVKRLDEALGRLMDCLKSAGLDENTVILFTSDHGSHFRTRNEEYKRSCHESSIRIPMAAIGPGFTSGGVVRELVSLIDLPPTLLDVAGIPAPPEMQGRSMLPLVKGGIPDWPTDVFVQISESQVGRAIRTKRWKYSVVAPDKDGNGDASSDTYVEAFLYDLESDPYELRNLVADPTFEDIRRELGQRLIRRMVEAGEKQPRILPSEPQRRLGLRVSIQDVRITDGGQRGKRL